MPIAHKNQNGTTNSTTAADVVDAPAASTARVIPVAGLTVKNTDTVPATVILQLDDNATTREIERMPEMAPDETFYNNSVITLETTTQKLQVVLAAAITTSELDCVASFMEIS